MQTIISYFKKIVEIYPDNIAATDSNFSLSYKKLDELSDKISFLLQKDNQITNGLVLICMPKSLEFLVAILGVLKLGYGYVPVDINYPKERIEYIINNSNITYAITNKDFSVSEILPKECKQFKFNLNYLNCLSSEKFCQNVISDEKIAYIIYTSGTTGNPKGVIISHKSVMNTLLELIRIFDITSSSCMMFFAPVAFDASIIDIFITLLSGATLTLPEPKDLYSGELLANFIQKKKITVLTIPPSILINVPFFVSKHLKTIVSVAEACPVELADKWSVDYTFINAYGPTEAAVLTTIKIYHPNSKMSIGQPIKNMKIYVLNDNMQPTSIGEVGKLYLSGIGLAIGYHNNESETKSKFISNPCQNDLFFSRLYDTGDLAKINSDNELEYVGRTDSQVKINGFRIELSEVENHIRKHPNIKQVIAALNEFNEEKELYAVYSTINQLNISRHELVSFLGERLPDYMMPCKYIFFNELPLTPNGKIDKLQILENIKHLEESTKLRRSIETVFSNILKDYLGEEDIDINDNFFDYGIKSIGLTKICKELSNKLNKEINILSFYEFPTIRLLSSSIAEENRDLICEY